MAEQLTSQSTAQVTKTSSDTVSTKQVIESIFTSAQITNIKAWYTKKNFSKDYIKQIQSAVGFTGNDVDGVIGKNTINKIGAWQKSNGLSVDGKFGNDCATLAGINGTSSASTAQSTSTSTAVSNKTSTSSTSSSSAASTSFSASEISTITAWYTKQNYSKDFIKEIQAAVGFTGNDVDGVIGKNTINKIGDWQKSHNLEVDGKFGSSCAALAGLTVKKDTAATSTATGKGINAKPGMYKQYNYKTSPYVSKSDYNKMKSAMGDTPYASWDINNKAISSLYATAKKSNGGNSTISSSGCGVTSYANCKGITPTAAAELAMQSGYRIYGSGTSGALFTANGGTATTAKAGLNAVAEGKYLIASVGPSIWTSAGHYILIYGYDGTNVYVSDPNCKSGQEATKEKAKASLFINAFKHGYLF